jgi:hypothetical protein
MLSTKSGEKFRAGFTQILTDIRSQHTMCALWENDAPTAPPALALRVLDHTYIPRAAEPGEPSPYYGHFFLARMYASEGEDPDTRLLVRHANYANRMRPARGFAAIELASKRRRKVFEVKADHDAWHRPARPDVRPRWFARMCADMGEPVVEWGDVLALCKGLDIDPFQEKGVQKKHTEVSDPNAPAVRAMAATVLHRYRADGLFKRAVDKFAVPRASAPSEDRVGGKIGKHFWTGSHDVYWSLLCRVRAFEEESAKRAEEDATTTKEEVGGYYCAVQ